MAVLVVSRLGRRRERRVGERADGDDDQIRLRRFRIEDLRAAVGAEVKGVLFPVLLVRHSREVPVATADLDLLRVERRLHSERASGPTLTGEAVADRDDESITRHVQTKLTAMTGGSPSRHRCES